MHGSVADKPRTALSAGEISSLYASRQERLRQVMRSHDVPAIFTCDPINIAYACGARNMTIFSMMGPSRFLLLFADGPCVLFEFGGSEHLAAHLTTVDEMRPAPSISAIAGPHYTANIASFANELASELRSRSVDRLAIERVDFLMSDALRSHRSHRSHSVKLIDATAVFSEARTIKQPLEIAAMRIAIDRVADSMIQLEAGLHDGVTEVEAWAELYRGLISQEGEYISTRLFQSGPNTFPYFQEAGSRRMETGDLVCVDTDAIGYLGYAVDFSRSFICAGAEPTAAQRSLYSYAHEQLQHNASLLRSGLSFEDLARTAWAVPERFRPYGYYCVLHGLGLCGEYPNVPLWRESQPYGLAGGLETGMVVCVESYIGCDETGQGVKLENQYLITDTGAECLSTFPFDEPLLVNSSSVS
jgi:Xaa-Pro dipeptidase